MNTVSTQQIITWLQEYHSIRITNLESTPTLKRSIQSSDLPCAMIRLNDATHNPQTTQSGETSRNIEVLVYVASEGQYNDTEEIEEQVYSILDQFIHTYFTHRMVTENVWIEDEFRDSGLVVIEFGGLEYIGFVMNITLTISNQKVNFTGV
jgi:hypothetical protein